jgi:hypothetical protein
VRPAITIPTSSSGAQRASVGIATTRHEQPPLEGVPASLPELASRARVDADPRVVPRRLGRAQRHGL